MLFQAGVAVAKAVPDVICREAAESGTILVSRVLGVPAVRRRRQLVARHLRRVYGPDLSARQLRRQVDESFGSYARYWAESLRLPSLRPSQVEAGMHIEGLEHLHAALAGGRGAIVALPHLGGWDWGGRWLAQSDIPVSVVVEALNPPDVFDWFVGFRRHLGMEVIPVGLGAGSASLRTLRANHVLCLLSDRVVGDTPGVEVEFFGERTVLPAGPVTLALRTSAPILPTAVYFTPRVSGHLAIVRPPLVLTRSGRFRDDVQRGTQALATELEALIRRAPTQWHLMQPNWPSDPR